MTSSHSLVWPLNVASYLFCPGITWVFTWAMQNVEPNGSHLRRSLSSICLWWVSSGSNHNLSLWWWCEQHLWSFSKGNLRSLALCGTLKQVSCIQAWSTGFLFPATLYGTPRNEYFAISSIAGSAFQDNPAWRLVADCRSLWVIFPGLPSCLKWNWQPEFSFSLGLLRWLVFTEELN